MNIVVFVHMNTSNTINTWKDVILIKILCFSSSHSIQVWGFSIAWIKMGAPPPPALQQRACSECTAPSPYGPTQFHLRGPVSITCHPIQHRLCWHTHLWCVLQQSSTAKSATWTVRHSGCMCVILMTLYNFCTIIYIIYFCSIYILYIYYIYSIAKKIYIL